MANAETFTGPYRYTELTFAEQRQALQINSPLGSDYRPGAQFCVGTKGSVKLFERPALGDLA